MRILLGKSGVSQTTLKTTPLSTLLVLITLSLILFLSTAEQTQAYSYNNYNNNYNKYNDNYNINLGEYNTNSYTLEDKNIYCKDKAVFNGDSSIIKILEITPEKTGRTRLRFCVCKNKTRKYSVNVWLKCSNSTNKIDSFHARKSRMCYVFNSEFENPRNNCSLIIDGLGIRVEKNLKNYNLSLKILNCNYDHEENAIKIIVRVVNNNNFPTNFVVRTGFYYNDELISVYSKESFLEEKSERLLEISKKIEYSGIYYVKTKLIVDDFVLEEESLSVRMDNKDSKFGKSNYNKIDHRNINHTNNTTDYTNDYTNDTMFKKKNNKENKNQDFKNVSEYSNFRNCDYNVFNKEKSIALHTLLFISIMLNVVLIIRR